MLKIYNKLYNTNPLIIHHPFLGQEFSINWEMLAIYKKKKFQVNIPKNLTLVTWNNRQKKGVIEEQLDVLNLPYISLGKDLTWHTNRLKIKTLIDAIDKIQTDYILGMDCYDVLIINSLEDILDRFKKRNAKIIYNASTWVFPDVKEHREIEEKLCPGPFHFLNGGLFIGEKEYIKNILKDVPDRKEFKESEQYLLHLLYHKFYPEIQLDWQCDIFQIIYLPKQENLKAENYMKLVDII